MERNKIILLKIEHRMMGCLCPNIINRGHGSDDLPGNHLEEIINDL
jgi:hypothetical protein